MTTAVRKWLGLHVRSKTPDVEEVLQESDFQLQKTVRHGLPHQPTAIAVDEVQGIFAVGSRFGGIRIMGQSGIESYLEHEEQAEIQQLLFLINEGALISVTDGDCLHMWTLRQKVPTVVQTLRFTREKVTCCCLPLQSQWLYVGTDSGNVRFVSTHLFSLSNYGVHWNQAISVQQRAKPGAVVVLSEQPTDTNKLLIAYHSGQLVLWDMKFRRAILRVKHTSSFYCVSWLSDGSKFVCGHSNGELTVWSPKSTQPLEILTPHGKGMTVLSPVTHVEWLSQTAGDPMLVFVGGTPQTQETNQGHVTIMDGKNTQLISYDSSILGLASLCLQPYKDETRDPQAALILLQNRVVMLDLATAGCPEIPIPHPIDIHLPPVTCTSYYSGIEDEYLAEFWSVASKARHKQTELQQKWPLCGGDGNEADPLVTNDVVVTGHADGSVRLWDASSVSLCPLLTVTVGSLFDKSHGASGSPTTSRGSPSTQASHNSAERSSPVVHAREDLLPIQQVLLYADARMLVIVTDTSCAILCPFNKSSSEICLKSLILAVPQLHQDLLSPCGSNSESSSDGCQQQMARFKEGAMQFPAGFQPSLCCQVRLESSCELPPQISTVCYNSSCGLCAVGTALSLSLVDVVQQQCVWSYRSRDIYALGDQHLVATTPSSTVSPRSPASALVTQEGRRNPFDFRAKTKRSRTTTVPVAALISMSEKKKRPSIKVLSQKTHSSGDLHQIKLQTQREDSIEEESIDGRKVDIQDEVETVCFSLTYVRKDALSPSPCLWVGMSSGYVICIVLQIPPANKRLTEQVFYLSTGSVYQMKFPLILIATINARLSSPSVSPKTGRKSTSAMPSVDIKSPPLGPSKAKTLSNFVAFCTDHQIKVYDLPPHEHCYSKTSVVKGQYSYLKAKVVTTQRDNCLFCLTSHGHIVVFSLPRLRILKDIDSKLSVNEIRIWRTFAIADHGEALYMGSPTEIQRISVVHNDELNIPGSLGDLYTVTSFPERPEKGFFKRLFGSQSQNCDQQELFGKSEAVKSTLVERVLPDTQAAPTDSPFGRAQQALIERQDKLSQLSDKTEEMRASADEFAKRAREIRRHYEDRSKKWWNVFL